ncbi:MAG: AAA family ATPase [Candidatus Dormibacteraeota bacterium]|nr:AAA family ATPase [Candidatus Dormibacteraeota bacterium]
MRLAIVGKGGVGKTTIAGTLALTLARRGRRVLALDLDPNPGMAWTLGIPPQDDTLPVQVAEHDGAGAAPNAWHLLDDVDIETTVQMASTQGPGGVTYLSPGKIFGPEFLDDTSAFGVRELVRGLDESWDVVADIDAATAVSCGRHLQFADHLLLVVTPQPASAITVKRLEDLLHGWRLDVITSMFDDDAAPRPGALARVPFDPSIKEADRRGVSLFANYPDSAAVVAIDDLSSRLLDMG